MLEGCTSSAYPKGVWNMVHKNIINSIYSLFSYFEPPDKNVRYDWFLIIYWLAIRKWSPLRQYCNYTAEAINRLVKHKITIITWYHYKYKIFISYKNANIIGQHSHKLQLSWHLKPYTAKINHISKVNHSKHKKSINLLNLWNPS